MEGFDLPNLRIVAYHDKQKSLLSTAQMIGRLHVEVGGRLGEIAFGANSAAGRHDPLQDLWHATSLPLRS